ncbi:MAG: 30S ribosome-binding factor RbfA [Polyangiaceae bacterium]|nr:30S ribosome-binding factor RbfA [Polyangiaceae bacterium]
MTADGRRPRRVADAIAAGLAPKLRALGDARLASLVVTSVEVSGDLGVAEIRVRALAGDDDPAKRKALVKAVARVAPRLRRELASELGLRRVPELRFHHDDGHDALRRVDELLSEIADEPKASD